MMSHQQIVAELRSGFDSGALMQSEDRKKALRNLHALLEENEVQLVAALYEDLKKPRQESLGCEVFIAKYEISEAIKNLDYWIQDSKVFYIFLLFKISYLLSGSNTVFLYFFNANYILFI
ncbi:unnamed protein product [Protopolystoma xenopodis]|uniref:Uncharacterized protein n=1 Tax=Protopolystoma xenopodis TaxID=117903 RepID=A0A3S5CRA7_9PLAT|nr:unnamed protein product [Protopolystoma xenopodis]